MMFVCGVATLDGLVISRPEPTPEQPQHLCLDAAYDSTAVYKELVARHYQPHVRSRGEEKREKEITSGYRARRSRGGTKPFLDQSLAPSSHSVGKESGELSGFPASGLCSTHFRQVSGFRISFKYNQATYAEMRYTVEKRRGPCEDHWRFQSRQQKSWKP